jgi:DNA-binding response OmpR family regulator
MRVLLAEDEIALAQALARGLRRNGFAVDVANDGERALTMAAQRRYDAIVLDRDLPGVHGDDVCRRLRAEETASKVLMLTASNTLGERVSGLNLGADDYVGKPVALMELIARLRALGRRNGALEPATLSWHDLEVDVERRQAWRRGQKLDLTVRELMLLEELIRADGKPLTAEALAWRLFDDPRTQPTATAVRVTVLRLRRKLGSPDPILSTAGHGYRLAP